MGVVSLRVCRRPGAAFRRVDVSCVPELAADGDWYEESSVLRMPAGERYGWRWHSVAWQRWAVVVLRDEALTLKPSLTFAKASNRDILRKHC
jgi:hypothetical protein